MSAVPAPTLPTSVVALRLSLLLLGCEATSSGLVLFPGPLLGGSQLPLLEVDTDDAAALAERGGTVPLAFRLLLGGIQLAPTEDGPGLASTSPSSVRSRTHPVLTSAASSPAPGAPLRPSLWLLLPLPRLRLRRLVQPLLPTSVSDPRHS